MTEAEVLWSAAAQAGLRCQVEQLVLLIGLACERPDYQDSLQKALSIVFDLRATVERAKDADIKARLACRKAHEVATEVRELVAQVHKTVEQLENRMDALLAAQESLERRPA